jgi:hypothetical protein
MDGTEQGEVDYSLAIVGRCYRQVSLVKHDTAKVLYSCELVGVGPKLVRTCGFNGYKH